MDGVYERQNTWEKSPPSGFFYIVAVSGSSVFWGRPRGQLRVSRGGEILLVFGLVLPVFAASDVVPTPEVHKHSYFGILFKKSLYYFCVCVCVCGLISTHSRQVYTGRISQIVLFSPAGTNPNTSQAAGGPAEL